MPTLKIDGYDVEAYQGESVLQVCERVGVEIPRFCYHERLSVPANCRMCLVEMERSPKPIASCAVPAADGQVIWTNSEKTQRARNGVMEFLLINHPLDCPICDQGGECDLQDQAMAYGFDRGRFTEGKRAVREKYLGPLIKTIMTRCIHCTRCVRFADEIAGTQELGATGRSEDMEIGNYIEQAVTSELSGNMIDICPVGALTSKPYAYSARPWELQGVETIDVLDAVGSNIRADVRGAEVMRVLPRLHEEINEEWIADKTRFAYDGLKRQRLDRPYVRRQGKLQEASWAEAFDTIARKLKKLDGSEIAAIAGDQADCEAQLALKDLMGQLGSENLDCRQDGAKLPESPRGAYIFNTGIADLEECDAVLLVGTNPRTEAAMVNARLRKRWFNWGLEVGVIGEQHQLTVPYRYLGAGPQTLQEVADGKNSFAEILKNAENPAIIVGMGALARSDGRAVLRCAQDIAESYNMIRDDWWGFNVLHDSAGRVGGLDVGFVPGKNGRDTEHIQAGAESGDIKAVYLLGADELDMDRLDEAFVIYQGSHGDEGAHRADVILPGATYTEKSATYVNTEGRVQETRQAVFPPGEARPDWKIPRALSERLGEALPYNDLAEVRARLQQVNPVFQTFDEIAPGPWQKVSASGKMGSEGFGSTVKLYYMTCPITRASQTMAECVAEIVKPQQQKATGSDG